jgi:hypothetical protein
LALMSLLPLLAPQPIDASAIKQAKHFIAGA